MHDTALISGEKFAKIYVQQGALVIDIGGMDVNGSLRQFFGHASKFISVDIEAGRGVDVIISPTDKLPFEDGSVDAVVSTSCFEHDPCFWVTFREMCRIVKPGGFIYVNAPSDGPYHRHPGDNWRFYHDAGQSLAYWSGLKIEEKSYPVAVEEVFFIDNKGSGFTDFVCIWKRVTNPEQGIMALYPDPKSLNGPLNNAIRESGCPTRAYTK